MLVSKGNSGSAVIDGRIYIVGGWNNIYISGIASTEVYNPETDSWSSCANMRFQRGGLTVETVGGVVSVGLSTVTFTAEEVVVLPAASRATAAN